MALESSGMCSNTWLQNHIKRIVSKGSSVMFALTSAIGEYRSAVTYSWLVVEIALKNIVQELCSTFLLKKKSGFIFRYT